MKRTNRSSAHASNSWSFIVKKPPSRKQDRGYKSLIYSVYTTYLTYHHMLSDNGGNRQSLLNLLILSFSLQLRSDIHTAIYFLLGFHHPELAKSFHSGYCLPQRLFELYKPMNQVGLYSYLISSHRLYDKLSFPKSQLKFCINYS